MKLKKSLVTLTAATAVALAGVPAAQAEDAATEPAATAEAPAGSTAADNGTETGTEEDTTSGSSEESGALEFSENPELQESVNGSFGWDEETTGFDKFLTILDGIVKVAKTIAGIPDLSALSS